MRTTFGADPELILTSKDTGEVFPACGTFPGTKDKPVPIPGVGKGFNMHVDNVMLEFSVPHTGTPDEMTDNVYAAIIGIMDYLKNTHGDRYEIMNKCSMMYPTRILDNPLAFEFGCSPDFQAHEGKGTKIPLMDRDTFADDDGEWRFAGGHIHIGYDVTKVPQFAMAMIMDALVGLPLMLHEQQGKRRAFYGRAGRFRYTAYGIEYRTPSNAWALNEDTMVAVSGYLTAVARILDRSVTHIQEFLHSLPMQPIRVAIDTEDNVAAAEISGIIQREVTQNG